MLDHLPLWILIPIFVACAAVIWIAGIHLSEATDRLDARLGLGSALGGLIVLAIATNLPEIVITVTAAASGSVDVAVSNILGGIALQTVVIVLLDFFGKRKTGAPPLTYRAASLTLVVEALAVIAILGLVLAGTQLPGSLRIGGVTPQTLLIVAAWVAALLLVRRAGKRMPWHENGTAPDATPHAPGHRTRSSDQKSGEPQPKTIVTAAILFASALATLIAGFLLEQSGEAASSQVGLSGILFGATVLALATSLPEISTGLQAIRQGDDNLAISDIFGGNAFLPVLFLVAGVIGGKAVLPRATDADVYLTSLAALLTVVYAAGLLFRPKRRILGMGVDSLTVLVLYLVGIAGLFAVAG